MPIWEWILVEPAPHFIGEFTCLHLNLCCVPTFSDFRRTAGSKKQLKCKTGREDCIVRSDVLLWWNSIKAMFRSKKHLPIMPYIEVQRDTENGGSKIKNWSKTGFGHGIERRILHKSRKVNIDTRFSVKPETFSFYEFLPSTSRTPLLDRLRKGYRLCQIFF